LFWPTSSTLNMSWIMQSLPSTYWTLTPCACVPLPAAVPLFRPLFSFFIIPAFLVLQSLSHIVIAFVSAFRGILHAPICAAVFTSASVIFWVVFVSLAPHHHHRFLLRNCCRHLAILLLQWLPLLSEGLPTQSFHLLQFLCVFMQWWRLPIKFLFVWRS
jgi:hypothetical protein